MTNLINCGTCGYPLTPEERTSLIERDGVMVKPAPVQDVSLIDEGKTAAQRKWVGLTDDELSEVYNQADWDTVNGWEYERAIEAKLKERNT